MTDTCFTGRKTLHVLLCAVADAADPTASCHHTMFKDTGIPSEALAADMMRLANCGLRSSMKIKSKLT